MILVDTSACIAFLRADGSEAHRRLRLAITDGETLAVTEPVVLEVLAGARDPKHRATLQRFVRGFDLLAVWGLDDYEEAADLYVRCRRRGVTVRSIVDCLIAQVALRNDVPILHADRDFDRLAECSPLQVVGSLGTTRR